MWNRKRGLLFEEIRLLIGSILFDVIWTLFVRNKHSLLYSLYTRFILWVWLVPICKCWKRKQFVDSDSSPPSLSRSIMNYLKPEVHLLVHHLSDVIQMTYNYWAFPVLCVLTIVIQLLLYQLYDSYLHYYR